MPVVATTGAFGCSPWTRFDMPVIVQRQERSLRGYVVGHLCRGAEAVSFGPVENTIEILQLQYIDKVSTFVVQVLQFSGAVVEKTVELPQLQLVFFFGQGR